MNPDVVAAVQQLSRDGTLTRDETRLFGRVARRDLVSIRPELRLLLYAGVLAIMGGVGELVRQNLDRIGPVAIAAALWIAALGALAWALRQAPPFSWGRAESTHLAFDYVLLLGVLLTGAALAYVEVKFTPLGPAWGYHLLVMSVFAAVLAVRGDSRMVAGIALTTFAAWRGVAASPLERSFWFGERGAGLLRANAAGTGLLFVILGWWLVRTGRKAHFEPVPTHLGWLLVLGAFVSGIGEGGAEGNAYRGILFLVGVGLAVVAFRGGRFPLFGIGLMAAYVGLSALVLEALPEAALGFYWFSMTGMGVLVGLLVAHQSMKRRAA